MNGPFGLDLSAVALVAQALDLDVSEAVELATDIEPYILFAWRPPS